MLTLPFVYEDVPPIVDILNRPLLAMVIAELWEEANTMPHCAPRACSRQQRALSASYSSIDKI
jgi:hypothetical protein